MRPASRPSSPLKSSLPAVGSSLLPLATAAAVVASASAASGQILTYNIGQTFDQSNQGPLYLTPTTGALYTDGTHTPDDLEFSWNNINSLQLTGSGSLQVLSQSEPLGSNVKNYVAPLSAGATIGPDSVTTGTISTAYIQSTGLKGLSAPHDTWNIDGTGFIGFETNPTGSLEQYGWLQVQVISTNSSAPYTYNVMNGAIQQDGSPITAGDVGAVPELPDSGVIAGSLAFLAGSAAMVRRRRALIACS